MFIELGIIGLTTYAYRKAKYNAIHKEEKEIMNRFIVSMLGAGIKNHTDAGSTFEIVDIASKQYGYDCKIQIPYGLSFDKLESLLPVIETNMASMCELSKDKFDTYATLKIINNPLNNLKYEVVKTKPSELFLGYRYTGEPYCLDMSKDSHLLISGIRGSGKSRLQFISLTNLLKNHNENEIEIYLLELLKKDLKKFKDMKQVKMFCDTLADCRVILERIDKMLEKRAEKIDDLGCENIVEYNKVAKIKMKFVFIFADEYSLFMPDETESEFETEQKNKILEVIKRVAKLGRSVGVFFVAGLQRSTVTEINSLVKSQMCRCSFAQLSQRDSENILGITDAFGLKSQECIIFNGHEYIKIKTPYITTTMINETLGINQEQVKEEPKEKATTKGGWHIPTPEEWKNIKDDIPEVSYVHEEKVKPIGQYEATKKANKKRSGTVKKSEVLKVVK